MRIDVDCARGGIQCMRAIAVTCSREVGCGGVGQEAGIVRSTDERCQLIDGAIWLA